MKQTLIKIADDHYVVVDDSEIKEGDWCLYANKFGGKFICQAYVYERTLMFDDGSFNRSLGEGITPQKDECKLITHSTQPFEDVGLNTSMGNQLGFDKIEPMYLSEVKELIGEVVVEKKANNLISCSDSVDVKLVKEVWKGGYNQALEDNKDKKYTDEDMRNAILIGMKTGYHPEYHIQSANRIIQSLQPKTQWEVTFDEQGKLRLV